MPTESVLISYLEGSARRKSPEHAGVRPHGDRSVGRALAETRNRVEELSGPHYGSITAERRSISRDNCRALEILGHAIEYLADEYALSAMQLGTLNSGDPRVEAVQLLILLNREVYFSNPEREPLRRRLARWLFGASVPSQADKPVRVDPHV